MKRQVQILNDIVTTNPKKVETPSYTVHFGDTQNGGASNYWKGNALCCTGDAHRYQTPNPLGVTCKVCMEKLKALGIDINEVPYAPPAPTIESKLWDEARLIINEDRLIIMGLCL